MNQKSISRCIFFYKTQISNVFNTSRAELNSEAASKLSTLALELGTSPTISLRAPPINSFVKTYKQNINSNDQIHRNENTNLFMNKNILTLRFSAIFFVVVKSTVLMVATD